MRKLGFQLDSTTGRVADLAGAPFDLPTVVYGDTILIVAEFLESIGTTQTAMDLTGVTSLRVHVKKDRLTSDVTTLTIATSYNAGDLVAYEDLSIGRATWRVNFLSAELLAALGTASSLAIWLEFSMLDATGLIPQTLGQVQVTLVPQIDDGAAGTPPPAGPTYLTAAEIAALYVADSLFDANTILKADVDDTPEALTVGEQTLVGRITGGEITALTATQVRTLLNVVESTACVLKSLFDANTILKADTDDTPEALTVGEQTIVGRITGGEITALTAAQVQTLLGISTAQSQWIEWQNDDMDTGTVAFLELDAPDETTSWKVIGHLEKASEDVVAFELLAILRVISDGYGGYTKTLQVTIQHTAELVDLSNVAFSDGGDPAAHYCDYDAGTDRVRLRVLLGSDNWAAYGIVAKAGAATAGSVVIPAAYEHD